MAIRPPLPEGLEHLDTEKDPLMIALTIMRAQIKALEIRVGELESIIDASGLEDRR